MADARQMCPEMVFVEARHEIYVDYHHRIVKAVESEHPPLHLLLGASTLPRVKAKIEALQKDLAEWESTTVGADYRDGQ